MADQMRPRLGNVIVVPVATIGTLAAILAWEIEHVGSWLPALLTAGGGIGIAILVARRARRQLDELAGYYERLLHTAEEQSRNAEQANRVKNEFLATLSHEL